MSIKKLLISVCIFGLCFHSIFAQSSNDPIEEIELIESKKRDLVNFKSSNFSVEDDIRRKADEEYRKEAERIDDEYVRIAEKDADGNVLYEVRKYREDEKEKIKSEIDLKANQEIESIKNSNNEKPELLKEIYDLQNNLKKRRVSTITLESGLFTVNNYAGDLYCWNTQISFYIGPYYIFSKESKIDYERISSKKPVQINSKDSERYNDYLDTVDECDALLRSGDIVCQIEYMIAACPSDMPSSYKVTIFDIRFTDSLSNVILKDNIQKNEYIFAVSPAIDISGEEIKSSVYQGNKTIDKNNLPENYDNSNVNKNKTKSSENKIAINSERSLLGVGVGALPVYFNEDTSFDSKFQSSLLGLFNVFFTYPLSNNMFTEFDLQLIRTPQYFGQFVNKDGELISIVYSFGFNNKFRTSAIDINFYADVGLGLCFDKNFYSIKKDGSLKQGFDYSVKFAGGVDFEFFELLVLTTELQLNYIGDLGFGLSTMLGFSFKLD